jgi:isoleucyl-tRNA synthetase
MPFLSEEMFQNLARNAVAGSPTSVHLTEYPALRTDRIDDDLERRMRAARRVVELGRAARSQAKTKVRTPLAKLVAVFDEGDRDRGALDGQEDLAAIVREELNVKALEIRERAEGLVREVVKPELKALGPKLGKDLPKVRAALAEGRFARRDGTIVVEGHELAPNEVLVSHEGEAGHAVARESGLVVALDTALTPELEAEGLARELAHKLNDLRKEAGFDIADRIALRYDGDIAAVVERYRDAIAEETLASSVSRGLVGRGHAWTGDLNGVGAQLEVERA